MKLVCTGVLQWGGMLRTIYKKKKKKKKCFLLGKPPFVNRAIFTIKVLESSMANVSHSENRSCSCPSLLISPANGTLSKAAVFPSTSILFQADVYFIRFRCMFTL